MLMVVILSGLLCLNRLNRMVSEHWRMSTPIVCLFEDDGHMAHHDSHLFDVVDAEGDAARAVVCLVDSDIVG